MADLGQDDASAGDGGEPRTADGSADELDSLRNSLGQLNRYVQAARRGSGREPGVIGPYVVGCPLIAGTLSWVYQARDTRTDTPVCIKIPFEEALINPIYAACLQRELKLLGHLRHPGMIEIRERQGDALILSPVAGTDFERYLADHSRLPLETVALFFHELSGMVAYLHHQGIVHHDLRPANFIVREEGGLCLLDFGIAAWRGQPDPISASGMGPQGDVGYMAPEQRAGQRGDARADIYTLGIVLYRMVTGRLPYPDSATAYRLKVRGGDRIPPPSQRAPGISKALEKVILKATALDAHDRYAWVEDLGEDLADAIVRT
jgi:serine/threonine protein kinase